MEISSIAEAKNKLPQLIYAVERGEDIHLTRHGKPVAVLISEERYQQLFQAGKGVFQAIIRWREQYQALDLTDEEVANWRDRSTGHDFSWD